MLNSMQSVLSKLPPQMTLLDLLLPRFTKLLQEGFIYWVDGGAGVGTTSASYLRFSTENSMEILKTKAPWFVMTLCQKMLQCSEADLVMTHGF